MCLCVLVTASSAKIYQNVSLLMHENGGVLIWALDFEKKAYNYILLIFNGEDSDNFDFSAVFTSVIF